MFFKKVGNITRFSCFRDFYHPLSGPVPPPFYLHALRRPRFTYDDVVRCGSHFTRESEGIEKKLQVSISIVSMKEGILLDLMERKRG